MADDSRAPFQRVVDAVRADVAAGRLEPGDRLPSVRALASQFGVAVMTAQHAIRTLAGQGLVATVPSSFSFVTEDAVEIMRSAGSSTSRPEITATIAALADDLAVVRAQLAGLESRVAKIEEHPAAKTGKARST